MERTKAIASAALFAAIHLIFALLSSFIPGIELLLVTFLPLASAIYVLRNNNVGTIGFLVSTLLLCGLFNPIATLLYIFPAVIVGTVYGLLAKRKTNDDVIILSTILTELIGLVISILAIRLFFREQDLIDMLKDSMHLTNKQMLYFLPVLAIIISICQAIAVNTTLKNELKKLGYATPPFTHFSKLFYYVFPCLLALGIGFSFVNVTVSLFGLILSLLCSIPLIIEGYKAATGRKVYIYLTIQGVLLIGGIFPLWNILPNLYLGYLPHILFLPIIIISYISTFKKPKISA